jgi:hypothetical protein
MLGFIANFSEKAIPRSEVTQAVYLGARWTARENEGGRMARRLNAVALFWWTILVAVIVVSLRPPVPVIWDDTPAYVESAFRTLEMLRPTVVAGRDPGYPIFLALIFAAGGSLRTAVILQEAAWGVLMIALAATAQKITRNAYSLGPIILVAMYPGLLMYRNIILPETIYTVLLNLSVLSLLLATSAKNPVRCWMAAVAILIAFIAACFKIQGVLVAIAMVPLGVWIARPYTPARAAVIVLSCATALTAFATVSRVAASSSDAYSVVFGRKTLFCNHLNIVLASEAARREIAVLAGDHSDAMASRLTADLNSRRQIWPTLGFYGDECTFDPVLDEYLTGRDKSSPLEIAASYQRIFLAAVLDRPLQYFGKVMHQMYYGLWFSWPPHGLSPTIGLGSSSATERVSELMNERGLTEAAFDEPIQGWILSDFGRASVYLFRALSAAFVAGFMYWIIITASRRRTEFSLGAGIVIVSWTASILISAAAHTLDLWRYLVPATPMVGLFLSMVGADLMEAVGALGQRIPKPEATSF